MDEYGSAPDENFNAIPLQERLEHKTWKARVSAYEELAKLFRTSVEDSDFRRFEGSLKKIALDSNAVAQESGLTTLIQFVENAPDPNRTKSAVVPSVVEKCLSSTRAGTKAKALDLILLYVEVDTPDPVIEDVLPGLDAKLPKLVATTTNALAAIIRTFGVKNVNLKPLVKKLPALFGHSDKNVRAEANALTIELYRWLGKAISPSLEDLKPVQQKELTEAFEKLPAEKPTPLKYLRSQQAEMAAAAAAAEEGGDDGGDDEDEDEEMEAVDALDLVDPIDVSAKMESNFYELLASKKWQERKEALDALLVLCKSPKISESHYSELVGALGKRMADTNINIVIVAANCLEGLALGLRANFNKYRQSVAGLVMDRLKERKVTVVEALSGALNAMYSTASYAELLEESGANVAHKNPQIRAEVIKLQVQRLKEIKIVPNKVEVKNGCELLVKAFDDGDAAVREATAEALGTLMKCCGEKPLLAFIEKLDAVKMGKVKEYSEKAVVKAKAAPVAAPPPKAPPKVALASKAPVKKPAAAKEDAPAPAKKPLGKPSALSSAKKPVAKAAPAASSASAVKKVTPVAGGSKPKDEEPLRYKFSSESAEEQAAEFLTPELIAEFGDSSWKVRLEAMEKLHDFVDSNTHFEAELIARVLAKKPGWKESNFQVTSKLYGVLQLQAQKLPTFSKACAALTIPAMIDKMGDIKLKKAAGDCLTAYAETLSLQFVLSQSYDPLKKLKAPKALADSLLWVNQQLEDFGIAGLQVRELIDFLKVALGSANAAVRTNAVSVLGILRRFIGPGIRSFVEDCNSSLLATIDAEFAKVADLEPPQVTKGAVEESGGAGSAAVEELFPKVDIGNQFTSALLEECADANWKVRKEGLEKVAAIVDANKRIKPNLGGLTGALKLRLADSNKNLQILTLEICTNLANAMGKPFDKFARILCSNVASCLTDQKENVRNAAIAALEAFATQSGLDPLVSSLAVSLVTNSPTLRKDLLVWLTAFCNGCKERDVSLPDLSSMVQPVLQCLQDRSPDVRKAGQSILPVLMVSVGYDAVVAKCSDLKGAAKSAIMPMLEAAKPPPPPRPPSAASTAKAVPEERGALNTLPSLQRPGVKAGARPGTSGLPGSKIAPRAAAPSPTPAPPARELQPSPTPALPSLPGPGISRLAPPSRLSQAKPGLPTPAGLESRLPGPGQRGSRLHDIQPELDEYQQPQSSMSSQPAMGMQRFDPMDGVTSTSQPGGIRPPMGLNQGQGQGLGGGLGGLNSSVGGINGLSLQPPSIVVPPSAQIKRLSVSGTGSDRRGEAQMDFLVTQITSDDAHQSIEAIKQLEKALRGPVDVIIPHINELVNAHTLQIRLAYTGLEQKNNSTTRVCKHLVNSLVGIFSNKELASKVQTDTLYNLLHELASRLMDKNLEGVESGPQLSRAMNVTMVKVLENSNRNSAFSALLLILVRCAQPLRSMEDSAHQAKFGDLIMKCLWKLTKTIKDCVAAGTLRPNELLADMNDFLVSISPLEWKRRAQEGVPLGDMPLRTVKTVLVELSSGMGDEVFEHLNLINDPTKSAIHQYLVHMTGSKKRPITQVLNPATQPMPQGSIGGRDRMSMIGSMTNQNLNAHNQMMQQQQQSQQRQSFQPPQSPQFQQSQQYQPNMSPRTPTQQSVFTTNSQGMGMSSPSPMQFGGAPSGMNDFSGGSPNLHRMSMMGNNITSQPTSTITPGLNSPSDTNQGNGDGSGISETEMNSRLTQIFTKIGTREETKQGISDLYAFQKMYPNMESKVNAQLARTGTFFQSYIRRGLANLEAEAQAATTASTSIPLPLSTSSNGGMGGVGSTSSGSEAMAAAAARRRESVLSVAKSESDASVAGSTTSADPAESYKDRLARLQQMFGYKSESKITSPVPDQDSNRILIDAGGRNSPSLTMRQQQELDYQQHQLQQQQILAQHSRSRPSSLYQSSTSSAVSSPSSVGGFGGASAYQPSSLGNEGGFQGGMNNGGSSAFKSSYGASSGMSAGGSSTTLSSLQSLQETVAAKERAQTVALMKERLARMKSQNLTSSQMALQQFHQQQASGNNGNGAGQGYGANGQNSGNQYF
ncbi:Microtubule-associated protein, microtubule dynamics during spindle orientation [Podila horticola]|nr:Microtubule-associated protein, microtubule dynamics during spindle orientation [Podila horticola]